MCFGCLFAASYQRRLADYRRLVLICKFSLPVLEVVRSQLRDAVEQSLADFLAVETWSRTDTTEPSRD
jgi:hypothetical protein